MHRGTGAPTEKKFRCFVLFQGEKCLWPVSGSNFRSWCQPLVLNRRLFDVMAYPGKYGTCRKLTEFCTNFTEISLHVFVLMSRPGVKRARDDPPFQTE